MAAAHSHLADADQRALEMPAMMCCPRMSGTC